MLKGMLSVSLDGGTDGELANSGSLVATEYEREQGCLLLYIREQAVPQTGTRGSKRYELLKDPGSSQVEKLYTGAQGSHILPKEVSEAPSISS